MQRHSRTGSEITTAAPEPQRPLSITVVVPIYNDWKAVSLLLGRLDRLLASLPVEMRILLVDDASSAPPPAPLRQASFDHIASLAILRLRRNLGHQRAIAVGLAYVYQRAPCDAVVVMDGDGEDKPEDVLRLIAALRESGGQTAVFADRARRTEGWGFRLGYGCYKLLHRLATGRTIRIGNFSILPYRYLAALVVNPDLWNHYAAALVKSRLSFRLLKTERGRRLDGASQMNFVGLFIHGLSAISVFGELAAARLAIGSAAATGVLMALTAAVAGMRLFAGTAVPGWVPGILGLSLVLLGQLLTTTLSFLLFVLGTRNTATFLPLRQYADYVEEVRRASWESGAADGPFSGSSAAGDGGMGTAPRPPAEPVNSWI